MLRIVMSVLALVLGTVGTIACIAAIVVIGTVNQRVTHATGKLFDAAHTAVGDVRLHVERAEQRVEAIKITSTNIEDQVKQWTAEHAEELAVSRLGVQQHVDLFLGELDKIEQWAATVETSTEMIGQALDATESLGLPIDVEPVMALLEDTKQIQLQLDTGISAARNLGERLSEKEDDPTEQKKQILRLTARVIATLTMVDKHIASIDNHLEKIETVIDHQKTTVASWVNFVALAIAGLMTWMGLGQAALTYVGWRWLRGGDKEKRVASDSD